MGSLVLFQLLTIPTLAQEQRGNREDSIRKLEREVALLKDELEKLKKRTTHRGDELRKQDTRKEDSGHRMPDKKREFQEFDRQHDNYQKESLRRNGRHGFPFRSMTAPWMMANPRFPPAWQFHRSFGESGFSRWQNTPGWGRNWGYSGPRSFGPTGRFDREPRPELRRNAGRGQPRFGRPVPPPSRGTNRRDGEHYHHEKQENTKPDSEKALPFIL
ncbi:MAG TPA: hypothetical protein PKA06_09660 [Gemmatales bacterium]|nr:hypothetical protein [Gemmatales bacterium]